MILSFLYLSLAVLKSSSKLFIVSLTGCLDVVLFNDKLHRHLQPRPRDRTRVKKPVTANELETTSADVRESRRRWINLMLMILALHCK